MNANYAIRVSWVLHCYWRHWNFSAHNNQKHETNVCVNYVITVVFVSVIYRVDLYRWVRGTRVFNFWSAALHIFLTFTIIINCESQKWSSRALWFNDQCTKFNFWFMGSIPDPIGVTHDAAPDQNWRPFCSGRRSLMWSDDVLCFICAPVAQCWSVTMYWLLQTDFIDIVRWSCSNSAIMPPK